MHGALVPVARIAPERQRARDAAVEPVDGRRGQQLDRRMRQPVVRAERGQPGLDPLAVGPVHDPAVVEPGGLPDAQPPHARAQHDDPRQCDGREHGERERHARRAAPSPRHPAQQREGDDGHRQHRELGEIADAEHEPQRHERPTRGVARGDAAEQGCRQQHGAEHEQVGRDQTQRDHPEARGQEHRVAPQTPRPVGGTPADRLAGRPPPTKRARRAGTPRSRRARSRRARRSPGGPPGTPSTRTGSGRRASHRAARSRAGSSRR